MKRLLILLSIAALAISGTPIKNDCTCNGTKLYGRVQIVNDFADFTVQIVTSNPDLRVEKVQSLPSKCGQWQIVDQFPDFRVKIVNQNADFTVQFVDRLSGL